MFTRAVEPTWRVDIFCRPSIRHLTCGLRTSPVTGPLSQGGVFKMAKEPNNKKTAKMEAEPNREQEIRRRAYVLYEERGREDGHDTDDWLRAEAEVSAKVQTAAA